MSSRQAYVLDQAVETATAGINLDEKGKLAATYGTLKALGFTPLERARLQAFRDAKRPSALEVQVKISRDSNDVSCTLMLKTVRLRAGDVTYT
jgi:hypothetical protein